MKPSTPMSISERVLPGAAAEVWALFCRRVSIVEGFSRLGRREEASEIKKAKNKYSQAGGTIMRHNNYGTIKQWNNPLLVRQARARPLGRCAAPLS